VVVGALEQDDHVLLGRVIANPLLEAATVNGGTLESVERDGAAILDSHSLSGGNVREREPEAKGDDGPREHAPAYHVGRCVTIARALVLATQYGYSAHHQDFIVQLVELHVVCLDQKTALHCSHLG
jgi:hypothetical protein